MKKVLMLCLLALACVSCQSNIDENTGEPVYSSDAERFRRNIATKAMGEDYVVYEYMDVRIDDVATLASAYCFEMTDGVKKAYLRDIYMYKNHKRRATFDCVDLAVE